MAEKNFSHLIHSIILNKTTNLVLTQELKKDKDGYYIIENITESKNLNESGNNVDIPVNRGNDLVERLKQLETENKQLKENQKQYVLEGNAPIKILLLFMFTCLSISFVIMIVGFIIFA
jgi:hypothetical protein